MELQPEGQLRTIKLLMNSRNNALLIVSPPVRARGRSKEDVPRTIRNLKKPYKIRVLRLYMGYIEYVGVALGGT
jgi:hypothetical protein